MNSNAPRVVAPVADEAGAHDENRFVLRALVSDLARAAAVFTVAYGTLLGILLHQYA